MISRDLELGAQVLIGERNWRQAGLREALRVLLFGRRQSFEHLGMICTFRLWQGRPYLTSIREAR